MTLTGLIGLGAGYIMEDKEKFKIGTFVVWFIGAGLIGFLLAYPVYLLIYGTKPQCDRYKLRIKERKAFELGRKEVKVEMKQYEGEVRF